MKMGKDMALIALGAGVMYAYDRYNKPVMRKVEKTVDKTLKKANNKLEDMM